LDAYPVQCTDIKTDHKRSVFFISEIKTFTPAQNANLFTINRLFWQVRALQFVLIVIAVSIGFIIGYITSEILKGKRNNKVQYLYKV
jgi:hypothetical protein